MNAFDAIPLDMLSAGDAARVEQVVGDDHAVQRLHELGLHEGASIEMVQPGSPCIIRLGGAKVCLREGDDVTVLVLRGVDS